MPKVKKETTKKPETKKLHTFAKVLPWILVIGGILGLISAAVLTYDHNKIAANPHYVPSCNLNPVVACGNVIKSKQAQAFDFPNPYIGLVAFPMVITSGIALLAGAKFKKWYWWGLEAGTVLGLAFVHWLFYQTVYRIHALCPYCMVVWVVTITTFLYLTLYNFQAGNINLGKYKNVGDFLNRHHLDILILWFVIIAALILKHFWYYYGHYF